MNESNADPPTIHLSDSDKEVSRKPDDVSDVPWGDDYRLKKHTIEVARRSIAGWLIWVFVAVVAGQYALVTWFTFADNADGLIQIEKVFNAVLPVVSGLVGAAATYYFTRERI